MIKIYPIKNGNLYEFKNVRLPAEFYITTSSRIVERNPQEIPSLVPEVAISYLQIIQDGITIVEDANAGYISALYRAKKASDKNRLSDTAFLQLTDLIIPLDFLWPYIKKNLKATVDLKMIVTARKLWKYNITNVLNIEDFYACFKPHIENPMIELKPRHIYKPLRDHISQNGTTFTFQLPGLVPNGKVFIFPLKLGALDTNITATNKFRASKISLKFNDRDITYYNTYQMFKYFKQITKSEITLAEWTAQAGFIAFEVPSEDFFPPTLEITFNQLENDKYNIPEPYGYITV